MPPAFVPLPNLQGSGIIEDLAPAFLELIGQDPASKEQRRIREALQTGVEQGNINTDLGRNFADAGATTFAGPILNTENASRLQSEGATQAQTLRGVNPQVQALQDQQQGRQLAKVGAGLFPEGSTEAAAFNTAIANNDFDKANELIQSFIQRAETGAGIGDDAGRASINDGGNIASALGRGFNNLLDTVAVGGGTGGGGAGRSIAEQGGQQGTNPLELINQLFGGGGQSAPTSVEPAPQQSGAEFSQPQNLGAQAPEDLDAFLSQLTEQNGGQLNSDQLSQLAQLAQRLGFSGF